MNGSHRALVGSSESVSLLEFDYLKSSSSFIHKVCDWPGELVEKIRDSSDFTRYFILFLLTSALLAYGSVTFLMLITNPPAFYIMFAVLIVTVAAMTNAPFVRDVAKALLLFANAAFYYAIINPLSLAVKFSVDLLMNLSAHMQQKVLPFLREQLTTIGKQTVQLLSDAYEGLKQNVASLYQTSGELVNRATNAINSTERLVNLFASAAITHTSHFFGRIIGAAASFFPFMSALLTQVLAPPAKVKKAREISSTGVGLRGIGATATADTTGVELESFVRAPEDSLEKQKQGGEVLGYSTESDGIELEEVAAGCPSFRRPF